MWLKQVQCDLRYKRRVSHVALCTSRHASSTMHSTRLPSTSTRIPQMATIEAFDADAVLSEGKAAYSAKRHKKALECFTRVRDCQTF